jgi:hypothetical protein
MVGDVCGLSVVGVLLGHFKNGSLVRGFCYLSMSQFFFLPHFGVSAWLLKCTKLMGLNGDVVQ